MKNYYPLFYKGSKSPSQGLIKRKFNLIFEKFISF